MNLSRLLERRRGRRLPSESLTILELLYATCASGSSKHSSAGQQGTLCCVLCQLLGLLEYARYLISQRRLVFEHDSGVVYCRRSLGLLGENQKGASIDDPCWILPPPRAHHPLASIY